MALVSPPPPWSRAWVSLIKSLENFIKIRHQNTTFNQTVTMVNAFLSQIELYISQMPILTIRDIP